MTRDEIQRRVVQALVAVAPEMASVPLQPDAPLRDQVDLDSMDFLRFVMAVHKQLGVEVPEADYAKLGRLADVVNYVAARLGVPVR
jgi:acyl carrier protein